MQALYLYITLLYFPATFSAASAQGACQRPQPTTSLELTETLTSVALDHTSTAVTTLAAQSASGQSLALPPSSPAAVATGPVVTEISNIPVSTPTPEANQLADVLKRHEATTFARRPRLIRTFAPFAQPLIAKQSLNLSLPAGTASAATPSQSAQSDSSTIQPSTRPLQLYVGAESAYPDASEWIDFDKLWDLNANACESPSNNGKAGVIEQGIQTVSQSSDVDPRIILAVILQESTCQLNVPTTNDGVQNPGLMQSHNGVSYNGSDSSIIQMIRDGVQGTNQPGGSGIQQYMQTFGVFTGLRAYNSGPNGIDPNNLNAIPANTGTASYCSDIANRLTGAKIAE